MQYNQPFNGNGYTNPSFYSCYSAPLQCTQTTCPEIVGEGEVTSMTLPDGTIQFFFMPTFKWWSPNPTRYQPIYPNAPNPIFGNTNFNTLPCNNANNITGTWFVRTISNPWPQNVFNPTCQRNDLPRPFHNYSDYNMNVNNFGYQLKFHNDNWTSTTDLVYFYPSLRQPTYVFKSPCKETGTAQIDTVPNNKVWHYEVICSKPCNCCVGVKPMSMESLVEAKVTSKSNSASTDDCSCVDVKKSDKQNKTQKHKKNKSKHDVICACHSTANIDTVDKSVTTYTNTGSGCSAAAGGRETQTCSEDRSKSCLKKATLNTPSIKSIPLRLLSSDYISQRCEVMEAETWQPKTSFSKKGIKKKFSDNFLDSSSSSEW